MAAQLISIYEKLLHFYGDLNWWPARTPYEVMVGAVLTQNTAWANVEKAIANFSDQLSEEFVANADHAVLANIIMPAGFFNQKVIYLKAMTQWYAKYNYDVSVVKQVPLKELRAELLATRGIGRETADSILLYAFDQTTFVIDAYTLRLCRRYSIDAGSTYDEVKSYFERNLPKDVHLYNDFHAQIVINAKEHCKKKPICDGCPLSDSCQKNLE